MRRGPAQKALAVVVHRSVILAFTAFAIFPFYWMLITAFKQNSDLYVGASNTAHNPFIFNQAPTLIHLRILFQNTLFPTWLFNTLWVGAIVVIITLVLAVPAAYSLARLTGRWGEYLSIGIFLGHLTVERAAGSQSVADAERVTAALRRGISVLVFPEGTFVRSAGILPFRLGAFKSAVETGCPVIPVTIRGTRQILPAAEWLPKPGPVTVAVSPPVKSVGRAWTDIVKLRDEVRDEIARRSGERLVGTRTGSSPASSRA